MVQPISRSELERMLEDDRTQLVDVLPSAEFAEGHLPDAINIPLKKLDRQAVSVLDPARPVVVY